MNLKSLEIGDMKNFTYLLSCPKTKRAALIDAAFEYDRVEKWVKREGVELDYIIATHWHFDHAGGLDEMKARFSKSKVVAGRIEESKLKGVKLDLLLDDGDEFNIGEVKVKALHTPGHSQGGTCFLTNGILISGDTLFIGQCGRTDLPGGSDEELFNSLQKLKKLDPKTIIYPGHDYGRKPFATLEEELQINPTLKAKTLDEFLRIP